MERAVEENLDYLVRFAFFRTGNRADAEDIVHTAVSRLLERLPQSLKRSGLRMYLFRSVHNLCLDHLRRRRHDIGIEGLDVPDESTDDIELAEEAARINGLLSKLPERESEIIRMNVIDELTFVEAAEILGIPVSTAKSRFKSGMIHLRDLYNRIK